ncbi:NUDIX domain-containing protein [Syntrophomonas palmitatica]|uniref:NUDIX domain-containing protein n=1 Tax=Syntrophomonas palmitatica TaxID=402877 RepID=UPI0006D10278|nr:NUDIX hydrolase [Syntrophomonas palmitatica]
MNFTEKTKDSKDIFSGRIIKVRVDTVELPDGRESTREIVEHSGAVAVLAVDDKKNLIMVRQYRKPLERVLLEIPAGTLERDEEPLLCAQRELEEETGFLAEKWDYLLSYYSAPGFCDEQLHLYIAQGLKTGVARPDGDEFLETVAVPIEEAYDMIFQGHIIDGKSIIGIQYVYNLMVER